MAAGQGTVSYLLDPDQHLSITPEWAADIAGLGVQAVRAPLKADARNVLDLAAYRAALQVYRDAGLDVYLVLDLDFSRPWLEGVPSRVMYPNEALGYGGNPRQNRWIRETCVRAGRAADAFGDLVAGWFVWNEPNLAPRQYGRPVRVGENVPPVGGEKAPALAPEVWASLCCEVAGWLRASGTRTVYTGSLSWLPIGTPADIGYDGSAYTAGYLRAGLHHLRETGVRILPFDGIAINPEGAWHADGVQAVAGAIRRATTDTFGATVPVVVGEWGWPNGTAVDEARARETFSAWNAAAQGMFFFQHPSREPYHAAGFGLTLWSVEGGGFYPGAERCAWDPIYRTLVRDASMPIS